MTASTLPRYHAGQPNHHFQVTWERLVELCAHRYTAFELRQGLSRDVPNANQSRVRLDHPLVSALGLSFCGEVISLTVDSRGVVFVVRPSGSHPDFLANHTGVFPLPRFRREATGEDKRLVLCGFDLRPTSELAAPAAVGEVHFPFDRVETVAQAQVREELSPEELVVLKARYKAIEERLEARSVRSVYLTLDYARTKFERRDLHEKTLAFFEAFLNHRYPLVVSAQV